MPEYITSEELKKLKEKLNYLKTEKTKEIAELLKHAASFGDLSENAAYTEAKEKQAFLQGEINQLEQKIVQAEIVEKQNTDKIEIGSTVTILLDGSKEKIQIVSPSQVNTFDGKISYESPLGKDLIGKKKGDKFKIKVGDNELNCEIIEIS